MGWVKFDDLRATHRKLREAGFAARGLDEAGMCQVSQDGTDGFVSGNTLSMLGIAHGDDATEVRALVERLVVVGRWHDVASLIGDDECQQCRAEWEAAGSPVDGWWIHDYLLFNPTAAEAATDRRRRQEAGRKGGLRSAEQRKPDGAAAQPEAVANAQARAQADASARGQANTQAVPSRPVEKKISPNLAEFEEVWKHYPRKIERDAALTAYRARRREGASFDDLLTATKNYAEEVRTSEAKFIKHGATFFGPKHPWRDRLKAESVDPYDVPAPEYR